jgi:multiple sugar transport system ATP-binding protein
MAVYREPVNRFVAGFLGSPQMNFLPASAERDAGGVLAVEVLAAGWLALPADCPVPLSRVHALGVRPEHWQLVPTDCGHGLKARVERVEWLGDVTLVHCRLDGAEAANAEIGSISVKAALDPVHALQQGAPVRLHAEPRDVMLFDAQGRALAAA